MKNYLITVITISICVGIYNVISPNFRGVEKYSRVIGMLVVLCVIITPLKNFMNAFDEGELDNIKNSIIDTENGEIGEYDEIFKNYLNSFSVEELKGEIRNILLREFEIPPDDCEITVFTNNQEGSLQASHLQILLSGKSIFKNPYTIEEYFENLLKCNCQVLIK